MRKSYITIKNNATDDCIVLHEYSHTKKIRTKSILKKAGSNIFYQWLYFFCQKGIIFSLEVSSMIKHVECSLRF